MSTSQTCREAPRSDLERHIVNKIKYFLLEGARPSYGNDGGRLAAHTAAFLTLSGLAEGASVKKDDAIKVLGPTAVSYHCKLGNLSRLGGDLTLTQTGRDFFTERGAPNPELFSAYVDVLMEGKANPMVISNPAVIKPLAPPTE